MFSSRRSSPEALYHVIPQVPVTIATTPDIELHSEDASASDTQITLDKGIKWVHFVLGCSVLLPWNGKSSLSIRKERNMSFVQ
jgi:equilibrative nucleoside transporter 1/2/3